MGQRLSGKRAIVTGAASGIGRASAQLFASEGAKVVAVDVVEAVEDVVASIKDEGGEALALVADAGNEDQVRGVVDRCVSEFGGLDVLYANAGISGGAAELADITPEHFANVLRINLLGPFLAIKHAAPFMEQGGGGAILCTASVAGLRAHAGGVPYSASKAGVISLVQTTSAGFRGKGIRVNAICPGLIETGMTKPIFEYARGRGTEDRLGQLNPTKRHGEPLEIARMALFLVSDEASYVNGQAIVVDGGLSASHPFIPASRRR